MLIRISPLVLDLGSVPTSCLSEPVDESGSTLQQVSHMTFSPIEHHRLAKLNTALRGRWYRTVYRGGCSFHRLRRRRRSVRPKNGEKTPLARENTAVCHIQHRLACCRRRYFFARSRGGKWSDRETYPDPSETLLHPNKAFFFFTATTPPGP